MELLKPPDWLLKMLPGPAKDFLEAGGWYVVLAIAAVVVLVVAGFLLRSFFGLFKAKRKPFGEDDPLKENLAEYPPPPRAGPRRLLVQGYNARVRLVVLAPVGKAAKIDATKADALLEHVVRGLGAVAGQDKPRVRVWPPQLSDSGFTETFLRVVRKPEADNQASRWVLLAGRAKVGQSYVLLGLGLLTDEATNLGKLRPDADEWGDHLKLKG